MQIICFSLITVSILIFPLSLQDLFSMPNFIFNAKTHCHCSSPIEVWLWRATWCDRFIFFETKNCNLQNSNLFVDYYLDHIYNKIPSIKWKLFCSRIVRNIFACTLVIELNLYNFSLFIFKQSSKLNSRLHSRLLDSIEQQLTFAAIIVMTNKIVH